MTQIQRQEARIEQNIRELASNLADLVQSGEISENDANKWLVDKQDQWAQEV